MSITFNHLHHVWPDGDVVLDDVTLELGPGRHGLVGANGTGKSTLLRLLAGELTPTRGTLDVVGALAVLPQDLRSGDARRTVSDVLGISEQRRALHAIEAGRVEPELFDVVGDAWDVEERSAVVLARLGLARLDLDRDVTTLSGGELVLLALGARLLTEPDVLLLDEPTNNLDRRARARVLDVVEAFTGCLVVASHDRELLEHVDDVVEARARGLRVVGGPYSHYEQVVADEQEAARRAVRDAESDLRKQKQELVDTHVKLARRARTAAKAEREKRIPKIVAHGRRMEAEVSAGRLRGEHEVDVEQARERLSEAEDKVRDDREIRLELPGTSVPGSRDVLLTHDLVLAHTGTATSLHVQGPERIALVGDNGTGKSTLLRTIVGDESPAGGSVDVKVPLGYLPQTADLLDDDLDVVANVRRHAPDADPQEVRAQLARLLFRGDAALKQAAMLSGGERLRANLACLLLATPAPQLVVLDEPTNNLDLVSTRHLVEALRSYEGALLVVSHDERFLDELRPTRRIDPSGGPV